MRQNIEEQRDKKSDQIAQTRKLASTLFKLTRTDDSTLGNFRSSHAYADVTDRTNSEVP